MIDLVSVLPTCLVLFCPDRCALIDVCVLRLLQLLRVFRVLKLAAWVRAINPMHGIAPNAAPSGQVTPTKNSRGGDTPSILAKVREPFWV